MDILMTSEFWQGFLAAYLFSAIGTGLILTMFPNEEDDQ